MIYLIYIIEKLRKDFVSILNQNLKKDKFKRKLKYSNKLFIVEDSTEIHYI